MGIRFSRFKIVCLVKYMQQSGGNVPVFLLSCCLQVGHAIISQNFITTLLKAHIYRNVRSCYLSRQSLFHLWKKHVYSPFAQEMPIFSASATVYSAVEYLALWTKRFIMPDTSVQTRTNWTGYWFHRLLKYNRSCENIPINIRVPVIIEHKG